MSVRAPHAVDFDGLYRHHAPSVYRYTYAVLGNHADAEDITQQTFLKAYRACVEGTKPRETENWLFRIAHNEVRRHFRSTQRKAHERQLTEEVARPPSECTEPSLADVLRALRRLSPTQRSALVMREFEGRSYAEIAQIMGMSQSALEAQTFRARRALAEELEEAFTCSEAEEAVRSRLDRRLPRRVRRRLKAHLQGCRSCERFESVQRRQRAVLKGLSVLPLPASLFLFRAKETAAAGLGPAAAAAGGSAAVAGGTAVGGGGLAGVTVGVAAKVAAVTAAAAVAGGVGYGVSTGRSADANVDRNGQATAVRAPGGARAATDFRAARAAHAQPSPVPSTLTPAARERHEAKSFPMQRGAAAKESGGTPEKRSRGHNARPETPIGTGPEPRPAGDKAGARTTSRPKQKPTRRAAPSQPRVKAVASNRKAPGATSNPPSAPMRVEQPPMIRGGKREPPQQIE